MGQAKARQAEIATLKAGEQEQAKTNLNAQIGTFEINQNTVAIWMVEFGDGSGNFAQMLYKTAEGYEIGVRTRYYVDDKLFEESNDEKHFYTVAAKVPTSKEQWIQRGRTAAQNIATQEGTRCDEAIMTGDYKSFVAQVCSFKGMHVQACELRIHAARAESPDDGDGLATSDAS